MREGRTFRRARGVVVATALGAALVAGVGSGPWWGGGLPEGAVLRIDDEVHDVAELEAHLRAQEALYGVEAPDLDDDEERRTAAQSLAIALVVDRAVARAGIQVSAEEVDRALAEFLDTTYPEGRLSFVEALAAEGLSEGQVVDELRRQLLIEQLFAEVTADVQVAPEEVQAAYEANSEDFRVPERREVAAIALGDRAEAARLRRVLVPATFAAAARRLSLDGTTAPRGGDLGLRTAAELQGPFAAAAFAAPRGQVFGPVRARGGGYVYLGLVRSIRPARVQPFSEVRSELADTLVAARSLGLWQSFLVDELRGAEVTYADEYRPAAPDDLPGLRPPAGTPSKGAVGQDGGGG